ncbi:MAG TPA: translocation/assembly module TamB domain-containing protein, partial [Acetobacteraceae bacterium]|nr:translocation/assembly module TamB domain-containing protein [Acetobacteraceae bacterium]
LPDLAPLAALGGVALKGQGHLKIIAAARADGLALTLDSGLGLSGGTAPLVPLLGPAPSFALAARLAGSDIHLSRLSLSGAALSLSAQGSLAAQKLALTWTASLKDLSVLGAGVSGLLDAQGQIDGPMDSLALNADLAGRLGTTDFPPEPVRAHLAVHGLPDAPAAELTAEGTIAGAPLRLALSAARSAGALTVAIREAAWKSVEAEGQLAIRGSAPPSGRINFSIKNLEDFSQILHSPLRGAIAGSLSAAASSAPPRLTLDVTGKNLAASGASIGSAVLAANVLDPLSDPRLEARLTLAGIAAGGITGTSAQLSASGPMSAMALHVSAAAPAFSQASLAATATLDSIHSEVNLSALAAHWHGTTLRLLAPARIAYAPGLSVAGLRLGMAGAEFSANGRIRPDLALTIGAHDITPALLAPFAPGLQAKGRLDADATLSGTLAAPAGHLAIRGSGLGLASGLTAGLPPASLDATADLAGKEARMTAHLSAGTGTRLTVSGTVPLGTAGALGLAARGAVDLGILDPILTAEGRRVEGTLALDAQVSGTIARPVLAGTVRLSKGMLADYANGISIRDLSGEISAAGDTLRIARLEGQAGPGTIGISGSIGVFAPNLPVHLIITARDAELPQSDLMTMRFDSDLAIQGEASGHLAASGAVRIRRAEIRIPDRLPPSIPVLHVVRAGSKPPPPPAPGPDIALNLTVSAAREIFVRGRGINAEFGGHIHITGTAAAPLPEGSFTLVRGQVSLAGKTLTFSEGTIGFNGGSPENPTLDLVATSGTASTTATLTIGGTAESPTVTLSSVPELPQDQILATLLFGGNSTSLSPFQIAEIANSLTTLTGVGPSTGDPLAALRGGLGLDQLSVGSSANGSPTLQAGRYLAPGVYVGANQPASGGGSQAEVQINLTKQLQLNATVGAGPANATGATPTSGTSVGITYQFQY